MGSTERGGELTRADFPEGFVFGVATSAYQIEGARNEGGKGDSIWDVFADNKGLPHFDYVLVSSDILIYLIFDIEILFSEHIIDGTSGEVAVDHYHRYKEDIELMAKLGFRAYRFSISWSRIFPDGLGKEINEQGVAFYNNLIDFMIEKGIQPYATLYHWDLPHNLHKTVGGWLSDKIVEYFALYAEACFANFGDRVKHWITINEPLQTSVNGYGIGIFAPGLCEGVAAEPFLAAHHQILAHAASVDVYRRKFKAVQGGQVGFVIDCEWAEPLSDKMEDQAAAARRIDFQLGWYLDPIYFGDYPESMRQRVGDHLPRFSEKDRELIRNKIDFIGLNHYTSRFIANQPNPQPDEIHFYQVQQIERIDKWSSGEGIGERAASEWLYILPWGIRKRLIMLQGNMIAGLQQFSFPLLWMDDEDDPSATLDQVLNDTKRVGFFKAYVGAVAEARKDGADVRGYFAWSFLDNFEWAMGFTKRFGLVYVDYKNGLSRHPKASAMWFSRFLNSEAAYSKPDTN
ncbi:hypothetical protein ACQ4PT_066663 [Festuca glaucescens]